MDETHEGPADAVTMDDVNRDLTAAYAAILKALKGAKFLGDFAGVHLKIVQCLMRCYTTVGAGQRLPPHFIRTWPPYERVADAMSELAVAMEAFDAAVKALPTNRKR